MTAAMSSNATNGTGGVGMYSPPPTGANDTNATDMADGYIVSASIHHTYTSSSYLLRR